jgi:hypothetical protein
MIRLAATNVSEPTKRFRAAYKSPKQAVESGPDVRTPEVSASLWMVLVGVSENGKERAATPAFTSDAALIALLDMLHVPSDTPP